MNIRILLVLSILLVGSLFAVFPGGDCEINISSCDDGPLGTPSTVYCLNQSINAGGDSCIDITENDIIFDLQGYNISNANGSTNAAINVQASDVVITNGAITHSGYGVYAANVDNVILDSLTITNFNDSTANYGVYLVNVTNFSLNNLSLAYGNNSGIGLTITGESNGNVTNSTATDVYTAFEIDANTPYITLLNNSVNNSDIGFDIGSDVNLTGNNVSYSYYGIILSSGNNYLRNNNLTNNYYNFFLASDRGYDYSDYVTNDIDTSNKIDGKELYYNTSCSGPISLDSSDNVAAAYVFGCTLSPGFGNITIENLSLRFAGQGILIYGGSVDAINISDVNISDAAEGVILDSISSNPLNIIRNRIGAGYEEGDAAIVLNNFVSNAINISNNTLRSYSYGIYMNDILSNNHSFGAYNNLLYNLSSAAIALDNATNLTFLSNTISYGDPASRNSTIAGRPASYRFEAAGGGEAGTINCSTDDSIYSDAVYGVYSLDSSYNTINDTTAYGMTVGIRLYASSHNVLSDLAVSNAREGVYIKESENVTLSSVSLSATSSEYGLCAKYYQLRLYNSTNNVVLDSVSFSGTTIDADLTNMNYEGNIVINYSSLPSSAPYETFLGEILNITLWDILPPYEVKNITTPINFTMYYSDSGVSEATMLAYEWNGTTWLNLSNASGWNVTQNTTDNFFAIRAPNLSSVFALFGEVIEGDGEDEQARSLDVGVEDGCSEQSPVDYGPSLAYYSPGMESSYMAAYSANNGYAIVTVTDNEPVSGAQVTLSKDGYEPSDNTNSSGEVAFYGLSNGKYNIIISKGGYDDVTDSVTIDCERCPNPPTSQSLAHATWDKDQCTWKCSAGYTMNDSRECVKTEQPPTNITTGGTTTQTSCSSDADCLATEYCSGGTCTVVTGECGYAVNHQWTKYECCGDSDCIQTMKCSAEHICVQKKYTLELPSNATVGDNITVKAYEEGKPMGNATVSVKLPNGNLVTLKTKANGQTSMLVEYEGNYTASLLGENKVLESKYLTSSPKQVGGEGEKKPPAIWDEPAVKTAAIIIGAVIALFLGYMYLRRKGGSWKSYKK